MATGTIMTKQVKYVTEQKTSAVNGAIQLTSIKPSTHILLNAYVLNAQGVYYSLVSTPSAHTDSFFFWLVDNYSTTIVPNKAVTLVYAYMEK